jgi:carbonic anhydrase/acetyltransferase-like protein (isoleucine patch superfamily)
MVSIKSMGEQIIGHTKTHFRSAASKIAARLRVFSLLTSLLAVAPIQAATVAVDPTTPLTNYWSGGEWSTDGNFDGWTTTQISGATVAGGLFTGTASGSDPQVSLLNIAGGPDLELAFYDYLDVRLQVPAGFSGNIPVYFGTTSTPGINASRIVTINSTNIPSDGAFHVYRIFFGPEIYWRGNLSDLRIDPLGSSATAGQAFALDSVRLGDLTGDIYNPSYDAANIPAAGANDVNGFPVQEMSSKHFRFCWDISVTSNSFWTANMPHGTLRNFEEVWKTHVWRLGFPEPSRPLGTKLPYSGKKYRVNITSWNGGYWTGADGNGIPWVNITPDGLRVDPPTWVPPHEFMHACQEDANTNGSQTVDGQFWENGANYGREQWLYYYPWNTNQSGLDPNYANMSHFWIGHGRDYYLCWPFWLYLDENPDNLPGLGSSFGNFFATTLWKSATSGEYLWDTLARLAPATSVQDIIGYTARRDVMWDYSRRAALTNAANAGDTELNQRWTYAELRQRPDDPTWWQTPIEFAPQQTGYKIIRLIPQGSGAGRVVSVNFHGLPDTARGAGWRASFVVVLDSGAVRYSPASAGWNSGTNSVTLVANENSLYLSVAGTPTNFLPETIDETLQSFQSSPAKARFPYEMQITGATPYETPAGSTAGLIQVANGGGWRASTATVDTTAYVGPNARVLGSARVRGNARILDYAIVEGSAVVTNNAVVSGHALVRNTAVVKDYAKVRDYAMVIDNSVVANYARILQHAEITAGSVISNWATVKGSVVTWHDNAVATGAQAWNDAVLDGDFSTAQSCSNGFQFGFQEYNPGPLNWINNRTAPRRLYAAYEFNSPHDSLAKDLLGVTDGYLQGNPGWVNSDGLRSGFLTFNGTNQFVILDRSLSDLKEITVSAWVKWSGGISNQPVWYFGTTATNCMFLTPDDGTGSAKFSITAGGATQTLAWTNSLPVGVWTHVAVSLSNGITGRLYVNGTNVATGGITLTPDQLNAPNVNTASQQNYLARGTGTSLPFFQGALDSIQVYTGPLTDAEIGSMQRPAALAAAGTLYVDLRATNAAGSSIATWTNLGSSVGNFTKTGPGSPGYSTNVAGSGIPGIQFNGTSQAFSSANVSLADLTGHSDRSIEVWAYNPVLNSEETTVSLGDRGGTRTDCAFNFSTNAGWGAVTHFNDDVPWGAMGFPSANGWHHLVYTYDGNVAVKLYVDGQLWYSDTLGGVLATPTGDPINIACQRASGGGGTAGQYFSGYLNAVRVWGGVLTASQVATNYLFGPWTLPAAPKAIAFAAISNVTVNAGVTVTITNSATDPNLPPLPITFNLLSAPTNAAIDAGSGIFSWRPAANQANTTNLVSIQAANNASPGLSATQSFYVTVRPLNAPTVSGVSLTNNQITLTVGGDYGPDYLIQVSTNLTSWQNVFTNLSPALPFNWTDWYATNFPTRFYRILLGP